VCVNSRVDLLVYVCGCKRKSKSRRRKRWWTHDNNIIYISLGKKKKENNIRFVAPDSISHRRMEKKKKKLKSSSVPSSFCFGRFMAFHIFISRFVRSCSGAVLQRGKEGEVYWSRHRCSCTNDSMWSREHTQLDVCVCSSCVVHGVV